MRLTAITRVLPGLTVICAAAISLAPLAQADPNPLVPYGTNPHPSGPIGHHTSNHDEADTSNGLRDLPF